MHWNPTASTVGMSEGLVSGALLKDREAKFLAQVAGQGEKDA